MTRYELTGSHLLGSVESGRQGKDKYGRQTTTAFAKLEQCKSQSLLFSLDRKDGPIWEGYSEIREKNTY